MCVYVSVLMYADVIYLYTLVKDIGSAAVYEDRNEFDTVGKTANIRISFCHTSTQIGRASCRERV